MTTPSKHVHFAFKPEETAAERRRAALITLMGEQSAKKSSTKTCRSYGLLLCDSLGGNDPEEIGRVLQTRHAIVGALMKGFIGGRPARIDEVLTEIERTIIHRCYPPAPKDGEERGDAGLAEAQAALDALFAAHPQDAPRTGLLRDYATALCHAVHSAASMEVVENLLIARHQAIANLTKEPALPSAGGAPLSEREASVANLARDLDSISAGQAEQKLTAIEQAILRIPGPVEGKTNQPGR